MVEMRNSYKILARNPEGNKPLGRPRCRWKDNMMDLKERVCDGVNGIHLALDGDQ
jgi:hypothetical protein